MSFEDITICVNNLYKCYHIYDHSPDRLKQYIIPRLQGLVSRQSRNYYREFWALKGVSFEVKRGETVGIIGRNGSGKSTLLQIICGTLTQTSGIVKTSGRVAALLELGSGFNPEFTGRENVYMNGALLGLSKEEIDFRFTDIASFADIGEFIDQPVKTYSSGMYVRLAFAVSACVDPDILIIDEALAVGDIKFQAKCFRHFEKLISRGTTILFVTHSTEQVVRHCDWAILLDMGQVIMRGHSRDVVNAYLDMLFGVERKQNHSVSLTDDLRSNKEIHYIFRNEADRFENRPGYNPYEYRWGNREAEIFDFCVTADSNQHTTQIETGQTVVITIWVSFMRQVDLPIYGLTIKTPDGITLFGSNSRDFDNGPILLMADQGGVYKVSFILREQRLGAGEYFLSVGVAEEKAGEIFPLDRRYDAICLHVANRLSRSFGLVDFSINVEVTASL